jgi:microcystin-dependent protein
MDPLLGEIRLFAASFAPRGFLPCDGRTLPISEHTALFSVLGTRFGGDGATTFALPDLRGRVALGADERTPAYALGTAGGSADLTVPVAAGTGAFAADGGDSGENLQPYLAVVYMIAVEGVYPSRW